ncbi:MAG: class II fructose-bisphosphate aldolase [Actinobacteria bacterium]|nr:class II fructose-bisphosphate aldolase [Cyanobacteriota bacterium]MCL5770873.1 class II fructose-bisphosphate aldolase [Actinomycetota bacterium]
MSYVNSKEMLIKARKEKYIVGAFNIVDYTSMAAVIEAAKEKRSPVIIQTSQKTVLQFGYKILPLMAKTLSGEADIPVSMILDHGTDIEIIKNCINYGWSSIMVDGSSKPFEENIKITKMIADIAHEKGVTVEGELGHIGGIEEHINVNEDKVLLTDPEKAVEFQKRTGVDSLAVAIGTKHGLYKGKVNLDFERLAKIMEITDFPIVIHGCSDLPEDDLKKIIFYGPSKMNISTEIKHAYLDSFKEYLEGRQEKETETEYEPIKALKLVFDNIKILVSRYMDKFGSTGKV